MAIPATWITDGLAEQPYGMLPLSNLNSKGSSSVRQYERITSYNWLTRGDQEQRVMVIPGQPNVLVEDWKGTKLEADEDPLLYNPNNLFWPQGMLDPIFQAVKWDAEKKGKTVNFQDFDLVTDVMNLQKMFAFCKGGDEEGMFRIDFERVGKLVMANRIEPSDWVKSDFLNFDVNMRKACTKPRHEMTEGPFQQLAKYQFGNLKILVRFDAHAGNYSKLKTSELEVNYPSMDSAVPFENTDLKFVETEFPNKNHLVVTTNYPAGRGFPTYAYPQVFFSGVDSLLVGWYKDVGDFTKPASYELSDINKLMKPLPYSALAKVHDLLTKIINFMRKCEHDAKVGILWLNEPQLEIFERIPESKSCISDSVRSLLQAQVNSDDEPSGGTIPEEPNESAEGDLEAPDE